MIDFSAPILGEAGKKKLRGGTNVAGNLKMKLFRQRGVPLWPVRKVWKWNTCTRAGARATTINPSHTHDSASGICQIF